MKHYFVIFFVLIQDLMLTASPQVLKPDSASEKINRSMLSETTRPGYLKNDSVFSFRSRKGYFPSLLSDLGEQATFPLRFKTRQLLILGASIGITAAFIHFDSKIDAWADVQKQDHEWVNKSSPVITSFGDVSGISTIAAVGLMSVLFKKQKGAETSLLATQALITSEVWVQLTKLLMGKEHPAGRWWGPYPSGHTAAAFSMATVFAIQYNDRKVIPVICYSAATLVGVSRLTEHAHWASDVFLGGLVGYLCGRQVIAHYNKLNEHNSSGFKSRPKIKSEIALTQVGNQMGLILKW